MDYQYNYKYKLTSRFVGKDATEYLEELGLGNNYADMLKGNINKEMTDNLNNMESKKDNRTALEYAQNLIFSKLKEFFIMDYFHTIYKERYRFAGGEGRTPIILKEKNIDNSPDWIDNRGSFIEVVEDYTGFWGRAGIIHLRENKLPQLLALSKIETVFLLALDLENDSYGFIEVTKDMEMNYIPNHKPFGGKCAFSTEIDTSQFIKINREEYKRLKDGRNKEVKQTA